MSLTLYHLHFVTYTLSLKLCLHFVTHTLSPTLYVTHTFSPTVSHLQFGTGTDQFNSTAYAMSSLAKPSNNPSETTYDNHIELDYTFLSDYCTKHSQMLPPTTTTDVMKAIQSINTRRSPDVDGLTAEHFRHAGSSYCTTLTILLNHMFRTHQVVPFIKRGMVFSVFRKKPPNHTSPES